MLTVYSTAWSNDCDRLKIRVYTLQVPALYDMSLDVELFDESTPWNDSHYTGDWGSCYINKLKEGSGCRVIKEFGVGDSVRM